MTNDSKTSTLHRPAFEHVPAADLRVDHERCTADVYRVECAADLTRYEFVVAHDPFRLDEWVVAVTSPIPHGGAVALPNLRGWHPSYLQSHVTHGDLYTAVTLRAVLEHVADLFDVEVAP